MGRAGSNERQREFVKEYQRLCYRNGRHEVWQDFVWMAAAAISNSVDKRFAEQREERYLAIIRKYTKEEQQVFPHLFALIVAGMDEEPDQDFLGELYMQLELGNDANGQFFTPYDLCKAMADMTMDQELISAQIGRQGYISVNDCACGAGATLVGAAMCLRDRGVNYQQQAIFVAQDIDYTVGLMCYIQLSLLGCAGYVHIGNTLTDPMTGHVLFGDGKDSTWYTPMFFSDLWHTRRAVEKAKAVLGLSEPPGRPVEAISSVVDKSPAQPEKTPHSPPQEPTEAKTEPTFIVSTRKKDAGQLMLDLG